MTSTDLFKDNTKEAHMKRKLMAIFQLAILVVIVIGIMNGFFNN